MAELKLIHGRQSDKYDHFKEYEFVSCRAVATRLMGVVALKVSWRGINERRAAFYQIMHLDYSEYGVDDYQEFECMPGSEDYASSKDEMNGLWDYFTSVMGGEIITIDAPTMLRAIESALPLASEDLDREYDDDENRRFRAYARMRLGYMIDALSDQGITSADCSLRDMIETLSPLRLSAYETINYFIMRMIDQDFDAAATLTDIDRDRLPDVEITKPGIQTLVKCDITAGDKRRDRAVDGISHPFRCRVTTLARDAYYHMTFIIWLSGSKRSSNPLVTEIRTGSVIRMSDYEASLQVNRTEYLTVFGCQDSMLEGFDPKYIGPLSHARPTMVPNGWLYTAYKQDNSHVDTPHYMLNDDVYGYALLSIPGELILMSHDLRNISMLDDSTIFSLYAPFISTKGRFRLDSSVFQTICQTQGVLFGDLVEPGDD